MVLKGKNPLPNLQGYFCVISAVRMHYFICNYMYLHFT